MYDLIRDAPVGQLIRFATRNRLLKYPEENPGFKCPNCYEKDCSTEIQTPLVPPSADNILASPPTAPNAVAEGVVEKAIRKDGDDAPGDDFEELESAGAHRLHLGRVNTKLCLQKSTTRSELEEQFARALRELDNSSEESIKPERLTCGTILVDWYSTADPANPQNWTLGKKMLVSTVIYLYTFTFYLGSSIYVPSTEGVMLEFGVSVQVASLGLSMYVLAYGIGPLLFSPMSEIPSVGRNPPYITTFAIYVILLVPTVLVQNAAGLMVLRFLAGFFGSPSLATGGASLGDMFSLIKLPYVLAMWAFAATCGPALGPVLSGYSVMAKDWRWSMWELLWLAGPVWILMFLFLPETSPSTILLRRAERLRRVSGNDRLMSQSEIDQSQMSIQDTTKEALWRPIQTMVLDPSIGFTAIYTALIYGIYYSFFEAFPIVYLEMHGFNVGQMGLAFLAIIIGAVLAVLVYWAYIYWIVEPNIRKNGLGDPERRLVPALIACFFLPVGLFIFAWTSKPEIHWIAPTIGIGIFTVSIFIVIQCIFLYLPLSYPEYAASLFAGNDFVRSMLAAGTIHFSRPLYVNLGVGRGVTILAALTCGCVAGIYVLYFFGGWLRSRSRFAAK